jgi:hypothetical protein
MDQESNLQSHNKVTVEELLQLKKYEKPDDKFWNKFDRELQRKTLQTLVKPTSIRERILNAITSIPVKSISAVPAMALLALSIIPASNLFLSSNSHIATGHELATIDHKDAVMEQELSEASYEIAQEYQRPQAANFVLESISVTPETKNEFTTDFADSSVMLLTQDSTEYVIESVSIYSGEMNSIYQNSAF